MDQHRKAAVIVGVLFVVGTVSGILSLTLTAPIRAAPSFPLNVSAGGASWISGALLVLLMGFSLAMLPVVLYPILKKHNQVLALGAVLFRGALEAVFYLFSAMSMFLMVSVSELYGKTGAAQASYLQALGAMLTAAEDWTQMWGALVFSSGALMIYALFYQARLVPRWLSGWGVIGAVLYFVANLISLLSPQHSAPSPDAGIGLLMMPLALQEMVFAVWLIVKGFNPSAVAALSAQTATNALPRAA